MTERRRALVTGAARGIGAAIVQRLREDGLDVLTLDLREGCDLQVRGGNQIDNAPRARGCLIAFPANVLHQVTPIRSGVRRSLVVWAVGPEFR